MPAPTGREYGAPPQVKPKRLGDYLEVMSKSVFQTGISWDVVNAKWDGIRDAFDGFDAETVANYDDRRVDALMQDPRVIRNRKKLESIAANAARMIELEREYKSFKKYLTAQGDFEGKVKSLKKNFKFLGETGSYVFLYVVGEEVPPHEEWSAARGPGSRRGPRRA